MKLKKITFTAIYLALAISLDYIKNFIPFLNMPSGGSINIALIPICISSFHLGIKNGIFCGLLWWLVTFVIGLNSWYINFFQYILDYIIPSTIVGISSIFYKNRKNSEMIFGIIVMMFIRTISIVISGAVFWPGQLASGSLAAIVYSLSYNLPYSILTTIMLIIVVPIIYNSSIKKLL